MQIHLDPVNFGFHCFLWWPHWLGTLFVSSCLLRINLQKLVSKVICLRHCHLPTLSNTQLFFLQVNFELLQEALTQYAAVISIHRSFITVFLGFLRRGLIMRIRAYAG